MPGLRNAVVALFAVFAVGLWARGDEPQPTAPQVAFFEARIRPVLVEHCYTCHSAQTKGKPKGGLLLDTRAGIRRGGESGPAVVPGDVDESLILSALRHESFEMPPDGKLPDAVLADFQRWVQTGAADPRSGAARVAQEAIDLEAGRAFWSFQPLRRPPLPPVRDRAWPRGDVDHFVLARLEAAGLQPHPEADRRTLARRAYFDLIGLPPTPQQLAEFLADPAPDAFERLVDRLLESPRFGERWGRHWLDVARFAESTGGGRTRILDNAWRYRDYVIQALNADKPFDRFVVEQLAGDLLPYDSPQQRAEQLTATSFLALGPINYELQDKQLLTMEIVDEQLDTVGRTFLGMTIGCARCHDHKFDPIPTRDYYALAGIFRSTKTVEHANVSNLIERPLPVEPARQAALDQHAAAVQEVEGALKTVTAQLDKLRGQLSGAAGELDLARLAGVVVDDGDAEKTGAWTASRSVNTFLGEAYLYTGGSADGTSSVTYAPALPAAGEYEVRISHTAHGNRASNTQVTVRHADGETARRVNQRQRPPIGGVFVSLGRFRFAAGDAARVIVSNRGADGNVIADAVQFLPVELADAADQGPPDKAAAEAEQQRRRMLENEVRELEAVAGRHQKTLSQLNKAAPAAPPKVISVVEHETIGDCPIHIRGSARNLGPAVPRGFLSVAASGPADPLPGDRSGRRELAAWIASPHNPLTARVFVNRAWLHLFGAGIVRTPDNFGTAGDPPSHPQLLDYLAVRFVEEGWSVKRLIKTVMLSRTYRQASDAAHAADPDNRLWGRMNRKRLEAEAIRDAILAVSGDLDLTAGGSLIAPEIKSEFGYEFDSGRRSVYVPVFRNTLHELFEVFDFADPNLVTGRRNVSTLPTQALYLMNSPFVIDQSRRAAAALLAETGLDDPGRITRAYERALGRPPTAAELELAQRFLQSGAASDEAREATTARWARFYQTLFSCIDFRYVK